MPSLDAECLRSFLAVVEHGGFSNAARHLRCTQSTASLHVRRLEEAVGVRLIERTSRRMSLTARGALLLGYARRLVALQDEACERVVAPGLAGRVAVGVGEDFVLRRLPPVLAELVAAHPAVEPELRSGIGAELRAAYRAGTLNVVIRRRLAGGPARDTRVLWPEPLAWVGPRDEAPPDPLPLVLFPPGCLFRAAALSLLRRARRRHRIACTLSSLGAVEAAVAAGLGWTVMGAFAVRAPLRALRPRAGLPALPPTEIVLTARPAAAAPVAAALAALIARRLAPAGDGAARA